MGGKVDLGEMRKAATAAYSYKESSVYRQLAKMLGDAADELEAAREVVAVGKLLPSMLTTPEHQITGVELLFTKALTAYARVTGGG